MILPTKTGNLKLSSFFNRTTKLLASLEASHSSLAPTAGELWPNIVLTKLVKCEPKRVVSMPKGAFHEKL